jgi:hypothetical protein
LANFKIKKPSPRNVKYAVGGYNKRKGYGIEIFYNMKSGRVFIADYFENFSAKKYRKLTGFSEITRPTSISPEFVLKKIEEIKQNELLSRENAAVIDKEQKQKYKELRRKHFWGRFKR